MITLELIAEHINVDEFLVKELGITQVRSAGSKEVRFKCPNPYHVDKNPSCFINREKLIYNCFGCGERGNLFDLIRIHKGYNNSEAEIYLIDYLGLSSKDNVATSFYEREEGLNVNEYHLHPQFSLEYNLASNEILSYITNRRFTSELLKSFYIGFNEVFQSITIPIIHGDKIVNIAERFINPSDPSKKIIYRKGSNLDSHVWGLFKGFDINAPIFTEGVFDAVRLRYFGYNAFACLSNRLSEVKQRLILDSFPVDEYIIVPDNDAGGDVMKDEWLKMLHTKVIKVAVVEDLYKDVDEMGINQVNKMMNALKPLVDETKEYILNNSSEVCNGFKRRV